MQGLTKQFTKNNTSVEFIATTDFFIKNRITEEQIYSIHFAHLSVDDIHTKNQCSTNVGSQCKQTMETLQNNYDYTDTAILITFVGSLYVGKYNGAPVFLKPNGEFRDFNDNKYWVSYDKNIIFIPWSDWIDSNVNENSIIERIKIIPKYKIYFKKNSDNLTDNMIKTICTHALDVEIVEKMNSNKNTAEKQLFVGYNRYERNYEKDVEIFIDSYGYFVDKNGNYFWPTYETNVKYRSDTPYAVYTFLPWNLVNPLDWKKPQVTQWYFNMNPRHREWGGFLTTGAIVLVYILLYGAEVLHAIPEQNVGGIIHHHTQHIVQQTSNPNQLPPTAQHTKPPSYYKFSKTRLDHDIHEKHKYEADYKKADGNASEQAKYKADIKKYHVKENDELSMRDHEDGISIEQQKGLFEQKFHEHYENTLANCKSSIESLIKKDTVTNSTMFGSSTNYNFSSEPTSDMTKCQTDFIKAWNKNEDCSPNCLYGDQSGVIGDSTKDSSSHISKLIESVSTSHAHNESSTFTQKYMSDFVKEYNKFPPPKNSLIYNKSLTPELNPSMMPKVDPIQDNVLKTLKTDSIDPSYLLNKSNVELAAEDTGLVLDTLGIDVNYIFSESKANLDQLTREKEIEHKLSIFKLHLADARKIKDNYENDERYKNMSDEEKGKFRANLERKISNYDKVVKSIEK